MLFTQANYHAIFNYQSAAPRELFGETRRLKVLKLDREFVLLFPHQNIVQTELKAFGRVPKLQAFALTVPLAAPNAAEFQKLSVLLREIEGKPNKNRPQESPAPSQHQKHPQRQPQAQQTPRGSV